MIFNSVEFALFFPFVFFFYWKVFNRNVNLRNAFIVLVSYFFYGIWDWRFLILIFASSLGDFVIGNQMAKSNNPKLRKVLLISSLILNFGILGFFKYFNFFLDSFVDIFTLFGTSFSYSSLSIILPVGISFYTFQTLSYTIDIYNRKLEPTKNALAFFAFVSFFPQLVAGPIERAKNLLPQFFDLKKPNYQEIKGGIIQVVLGLFKKIVIADRLAIYVDATYGNVEDATGLPMLFGVIFFGFQLYLDFSAYSDIAIGLARTLGFKLSINFKRPYLAKSFSDFWTRWHISLSSWFKDYLYIPLGGNKKGRFLTMRNVMIVFLLSGLWHGASWNFVIWGALNGLFLLVFDRLLMRGNKKILFSTWIVVICWMFSLVFFRAETLSESLLVFQEIGLSNGEALYNFGLNAFEFKMAIYLLIGTLIIEMLLEKNKDVVQWLVHKNAAIRYAFYIVLVGFILFFGSYGVGMNDANFIYFQF